MKTSLSNQEKKNKRAEAHRRAILWSKRDLRKRQLKRTQARVETICLSDKPQAKSNKISPPLYLKYLH